MYYNYQRGSAVRGDGGDGGDVCFGKDQTTTEVSNNVNSIKTIIIDLLFDRNLIHLL